MFTNTRVIGWGSSSDPGSFTPKVTRTRKTDGGSVTTKLAYTADTVLCDITSTYFSKETFGCRRRTSTEHYELHRHVPFEFLLEHCKSEYEGYLDENDVGLEGRLVALNTYYRSSAECESLRQGYRIIRGQHDWYEFVIDDEVLQAHEQWYRENGASKQVAKEARATLARAICELAQRYYAGGLSDSYHYVACDVELGPLSYSDSLGYVYCENPDQEPLTLYSDILDNVMGQMEKDGFIITGIPDEFYQSNSSECRKQNLRERHRRNLGLFNRK